MDTIFKVEFTTTTQTEEFYKAVKNTDGVKIVTNYDLGYRLQGDEEAFDNLSETLKDQESEEQEYDQYEFAEANRKARLQFNKARENR